MPTRVMILNGPNLNLLGVREPEIYGTTTLAQVEANCRAFAKTADMTIDFRQSNHEGQLIDWVQAARETADAIVINPAGYTFTSVSLMDALKIFKGPVIEVHITNVHAREATYHHSKVSPIAKAVICGLGVYGYIAALQGLVEMATAR